jgi:hypothetical protein
MAGRSTPERSACANDAEEPLERGLDTLGVAGELALFEESEYDRRDEAQILLWASYLLNECPVRGEPVPQDVRVEVSQLDLCPDLEQKPHPVPLIGSRQRPPERFERRRRGGMLRELFHHELRSSFPGSLQDCAHERRLASEVVEQHARTGTQSLRERSQREPFQPVCEHVVGRSVEGPVPTFGVGGSPALSFCHE